MRRHIISGVTAVIDDVRVSERRNVTYLWVDKSDSHSLIQQIEKLTDDPVRFMATSQSAGVAIE